MPAYNFVLEVLNPYMKECGPEKRLSTQKAESYCAERLAEFFHGLFVTFAEQKLSKAINGSKVREYREKRKATGVSPLTVKRELALASKACNYAISEWDYSMPNPFAKRLISDRDAKAVLSKRRKRVVTDWEQSELSRVASPILRDIIAFAVNTGLRQGEICNLRWSQLQGDEIAFMPDQQKNGRFGKRAMNSVAIAVVAAQPRVSEHVFTLNGRRLAQRRVQRMFEEARRRVGLNDVVFKDLRKTCGSRMLGIGKGRMEDVKTQLGHADIRTTQDVYAEDSVANAKEILNRIG